MEEKTAQGKEGELKIQRESMIQDCLNMILEAADPEEALRRILSYLGEVFSCDRVYIFELRGEITHNTYEWCASGVWMQKEILQSMPVKHIDWWIDKFQKEENVLIQNLEEIRSSHPALYAILKAQNIQGVAEAGIMRKGQLMGFLGVDNPSFDSPEVLLRQLKTASYFCASLLYSRNLYRSERHLYDRDHQTGALRHSFLFRDFWQKEHLQQVGVIACEVLSSTENEDAAHKVLNGEYTFIRSALETDSVYRVGEKRFVAVLTGASQEEFSNKIRKMKKWILQDSRPLVVGYAWSENESTDLDQLLLRADQVLNEQKKQLSVQGCVQDFPEGSSSSLSFKAGMFYQFLKKTHYDLEVFFQSMTQENKSSYFYFGDMQKDLFYISDNLKEEFGFPSNIVPGFLNAWECRIVSEKSRELYREEHEVLIREKRSVHDLRYQVRDIWGKIIWIRCYGIVKWNEDRSLPLFFSGRITHQDQEFVIDPVTNFPRTIVMLRKLEEKKESMTPVRAIGFSLNSITEINNTRGRAYTDHLVQMIAEELVNKLASKMAFYRLDGMRCLALLDTSCVTPKEELIGEIRDIVSKWYRVMEISVQQSCSLAYMEYRSKETCPEDFLEQMVSLIKVAKHDSILGYEEYQGDNIRKVKNMAEMSLVLCHDVMHGMEHFRIVVQPVVSSDGTQMVGGEVLLRWEYKGKDVPPSIFVPLLEKNNLISFVGRWVFEQTVCAYMRLQAFEKDLTLAFNVSLRQLSDGGFAGFMKNILKKYQVEGKYLVAEVTEDFMDEQPEQMFSFMDQCHQMGIRIALDDFGNGYSSLRRLLQYPSNIIKLDRALLGEMMESKEKKNFIASIVYACHRFGKTVCMEGVETLEQNRMIQETGCDMMQGFYYYRPMELEQLYQKLATD